MITKPTYSECTCMCAISRYNRQKEELLKGIDLRERETKYCVPEPT